MSGVNISDVTVSYKVCFFIRQVGSGMVGDGIEKVALRCQVNHALIKKAVQVMTPGDPLTLPEAAISF
jgi:hypothetical protein